MTKMNLHQSHLGKETSYTFAYDAGLLFPLTREEKRKEIGITETAPFYGEDIWNHYEVSWLNKKGKPIAAVAIIRYSCHSPQIVESKSLKLYFNSFNQTQFSDQTEVRQIITRDLSAAVGAEVTVTIIESREFKAEYLLPSFEKSICIDDLDVTCETYLTAPQFLVAQGEVVTETLHSDLLRSNCLITNQPDWGSVMIAYTGQQIDREGLLKYIVSFRNHNEFHEQCIERIFMDIMRQCQPESLTVYGRYTRRGGLDINPYRSTNPDCKVSNTRLFRQ